MLVVVAYKKVLKIANRDMFLRNGHSFIHFPVFNFSTSFSKKCGKSCVVTFSCALNLLYIYTLLYGA